MNRTLHSILLKPPWLRVGVRLRPRLSRRTYSTSTPSNEGAQGGCATKEKVYPTLPLPSLIRSIAEMRKSGTLSTVIIHSERVSGPQVYGTPFMPYILIGDGKPIFALAPHSEHISHLEGYADASLVIYPLTPLKHPPSQLGLFRINLTGEMNKVPDDAKELAFQRFCALHPGAKEHGPYEFYSLDVKNVYYYAKGITDMISVGEYEKAELDPVAVNSKKILDKLGSINSQYALILMCKDYGNFAASQVVPYWVDKFGFNVVAKNEENQWTDVRFPFPYEMKGVDDCMDSLANSIDFIIDKYTIKPKP